MKRDVTRRVSLHCGPTAFVLHCTPDGEKMGANLFVPAVARSVFGFSGSPSSLAIQLCVSDAYGRVSASISAHIASFSCCSSDYSCRPVWFKLSVLALLMHAYINIRRASSVLLITQHLIVFVKLQQDQQVECLRSSADNRVPFCLVVTAVTCVVVLCLLLPASQKKWPISVCCCQVVVHISRPFIPHSFDIVVVFRSVLTNILIYRLIFSHLPFYGCR